MGLTFIESSFPEDSKALIRIKGCTLLAKIMLNKELFYTLFFHIFYESVTDWQTHPLIDLLARDEKPKFLKDFYTNYMDLKKREKKEKWERYSHSLSIPLAGGRRKRWKKNAWSPPPRRRAVSLQKGTNQPATRMSLNRSQRSCRSTKYGTQAKT